MNKICWNLFNLFWYSLWNLYFPLHGFQCRIAHYVHTINFGPKYPFKYFKIFLTLLIFFPPNSLFFHSVNTNWTYTPLISCLIWGGNRKNINGKTHFSLSVFVWHRKREMKNPFFFFFSFLYLSFTLLCSHLQVLQLILCSCKFHLF